jgi:hypothetical protein
MTDTTFPTATTWMMHAADGYRACFEACTCWQQELARFADQRLAHNRGAWDAFLSSRDLGTVLKVQQDWAVQAAADYTQEATRLNRLFTSVSLTGATPAVLESAALVA